MSVSPLSIKSAGSAGWGWDVVFVLGWGVCVAECKTPKTPIIPAFYAELRGIVNVFSFGRTSGVHVPQAPAPPGVFVGKPTCVWRVSPSALNIPPGLLVPKTLRLSTEGLDIAESLGLPASRQQLQNAGRGHTNYDYLCWMEPETWSPECVNLERNERVGEFPVSELCAGGYSI